MSVVALMFIVMLCLSVRVPAQTFQQMSALRSGITFRNDIVESDTFNVLADFYAYNGGGVGVGDLNGDGYQDLVFTSTQNGVGTYISNGDLTYRDVSQTCGIRLDDASVNTGVLIADLNGDGYLDVYVCRRYLANRLFVNDGKGRFSDVSQSSALSFRGFSSQAAVVDYDRDGDLDVFVVNSGEPRRKGYLNPGLCDKLFRNDGNGVFVDVTTAAGIRDKGYGLSASIGDLNNDGWPDIVVTNDFEERDALYLNKQDGTFADSAQRAMANMSWASMGSDIGDVNDDGLLDIITVDMLPKDNYRRQTQLGGMSIYGPFFDSLQRVHNALHLNRGNGRFSNICYQAGIAATDWSWSVLMGDVDLDGRLDMFMTNGTKRDIGDQDYSYNLFAGAEPMRSDAYKSMPRSQLSNFLFRNTTGLRFTDVTMSSGLVDPQVSNGAAMVDLDNDGDIDIVVNNTDTVPSIYINRTIEARGAAARWVGIALRGTAGNMYGVGARVTLHAGARTFTREVTASRGFHSTSDMRIVFGLGTVAAIDSCVVRWPTGVTSTHTTVPLNSYTTLQIPTTAIAWKAEDLNREFMSKRRRASIPFFHKENAYDDFKRERLLPYRFSKDGPGVAVGDVNGDGMADVVLTGAKYQGSAVFLQQRDETFIPWQCGINDVTDAEDVDASLVDIDADKDLDLVIVTGGNEFSPNDPELEDRLYRNDGKGTFTRIPNGLSAGNHSGSCVVPADYDGDGDIDLFIGGRCVPGKFPAAARSVLYRNDKGTYTDVTDKIAPGLSRCGLTSQAVWVDIDKDKDLDLVVVGQWMTPRVWRNTKGMFSEVTTSVGFDGQEGWWLSVAAADVDNDGDMDLVAGNIGLNAKFTPEPGKPIICYISDFDENGSLDHLVTYDVDGRRMPTRGRTTILAHMPTLTRKYNTFSQFANADIDDVIAPAVKDTAQQLVARTFASTVFLNTDGRFVAQPLPDMAQLAPVMAVLPRDLDGDGDQDLVVAGNAKTQDGDIIGYDAGMGLVLRNDRRGLFTPIEPWQSGFSAPHDSRRMAVLPVPGKHDLLVLTVNGRSPRVFDLQAFPMQTKSSR